MSTLISCMCVSGVCVCAYVCASVNQMDRTVACFSIPVIMGTVYIVAHSPVPDVMALASAPMEVTRKTVMVSVVNYVISIMIVHFSVGPSLAEFT